MIWIRIALNTVGALIPPLIWTYLWRRNVRKQVEPKTIEEFRQEVARLREIVWGLSFWLLFSSAWIWMVAPIVKWTELGEYTSWLVVAGLVVIWGLVMYPLSRLFFRSAVFHQPPQAPANDKRT